MYILKIGTKISSSYLLTGIDDCKKNECNMKHTKGCVDDHMSYQCVCLDRYHGDKCQESKWDQMFDIY